MMRLKHGFLFALLLSSPLAYAEMGETEPSLELLEMLGESDDEIADLDIAMADIPHNTQETLSTPSEVHHDE